MALAIFVITLICVLIKPFNLQIWVYSSIGAVFICILQLITLDDALEIFHIVADSSLTLIGLILISLSLEHLGFFDYLVYKLLKIAGGKGEPGTDLTLSVPVFCVIILTFTAVLAGVFANDGAILILTPLLITLFSKLEQPRPRFVAILMLCMAFTCDATSLPLIVSNLTNIITAEYFSLGFNEFFGVMWLPDLTALAALMLIFFGLYGRSMPKRISFVRTPRPRISWLMLWFCVLFVVLFLSALFVGELLHLPVSIPVLGAAMLLLCVVAVRDIKGLKPVVLNAPYGIIIFSFSLYIIVYALYKEGLGSMLTSFYATLTARHLGDVLWVSLMSALGSAVFNNLPMVMLGNLALNDFFATIPETTLPSFVYAHLLACDIGAKLTPIGSLSTLLWLNFMEQRGYSISVGKYFRFSLALTLLVLMCATTVMYFMV